MKIGIDAKRAFNNFAGLGNYSRVLISGLQQYYPEHSLFLFSAKEKEELSNLIPPPYQRIKPDAFPSTLFNSWWRSRGCINEIEKLDLDIYHGCSNEIPIFNKKSKTKFVVTIQDVLYLHDKEQFPVIDRFIYHQKVSYALKNAHAIITNSEIVKSDLLSYYNTEEDKIHVIYQAADSRYKKITDIELLNSVKRKYQLPDKFILNVSSFYPRKNQKLIIEAFANIENNSCYKLVFVGKEGSELENLKTQVAQKGISENVHFLTNVITEDLPFIYNLAKTFVYPSINEGYGIPVLEAMMCETPVISMVGTSMEEMARDSALYISHKDDVDGVKELLQMLTTENNIREIMINRGNQRAALFNFKNYMEDVMKVYNQCLQ